MPDYSLTLTFASSDLETIHAARESVVLARAFSDSDSNVAWVSFVPTPNNVVSWDDGYGLYFASALSPGGIQMGNAPTGVLLSGASYQLDSTDRFTFLPQDPPPGGAYRVFNQVPFGTFPALFLGLTQGAIVLGSDVPPTPAVSALVPATQFATFTPIASVYVWLQSNVASGMPVQLPPLARGSEKALSSFATLIPFAAPSALTFQYVASLGAFLPA